MGIYFRHAPFTTWATVVIFAALAGIVLTIIGLQHPSQAEPASAGTPTRWEMHTTYGALVRATTRTPIIAVATDIQTLCAGVTTDPCASIVDDVETIIETLEVFPNETLPVGSDIHRLVVKHRREIGTEIGTYTTR